MQCKIDAERTANCVQDKVELIRTAQVSDALDAGVANPEATMPPALMTAVEIIRKAVLRRAKLVQDDGRNEEHSQRVGDVIQSAIARISEMPLHAAPRMKANVERRRRERRECFSGQRAARIGGHMEIQ